MTTMNHISDFVCVCVCVAQEGRVQKPKETYGFQLTDTPYFSWYEIVEF